MNIAILGTGNVGGALGVRFARAGHSVIFGTRRPTEIEELLKAAGPNAKALSGADAAKASEIIFLAVPAQAAVMAATALGDLSGKIVVDCVNPVRWEQGPVWNPPAEGSIAAALSNALPGARVVKAFNAFGAEIHANPSVGGAPADVFMAGEDKEAKNSVAELAASAGFHAIDAGPLRNAAVLENLAILWIHLATVGGQGRQTVFRWVKR